MVCQSTLHVHFAIAYMVEPSPSHNCFSLGQPLWHDKAERIKFLKLGFRLLSLGIPISRTQDPSRSVSCRRSFSGGGADKSRRLNGEGGVSDG